MPRRTKPRRNTKPRKTKGRKIAGRKPTRNTLTSKVNRLITVANRRTNWIQFEYPMADSSTNLSTSSITSYKNCFCRNIIRPIEWNVLFQGTGNQGLDCKEYAIHSLRVNGVINLNAYEGLDMFFTIAIVSPKGPLAEQTADRLFSGTGGLIPDEDFVPLTQYGTGTGASGNPTLIMLNKSKFHIYYQRRFYMSTVNDNVGAEQAGISANLSNQKKFFRKYIKFNKVLRNQDDNFTVLGTGDINPRSTLWVIGFTDLHNLTPTANSQPSLCMNSVINGRTRD